jgi:hypothetical protein
MNDSTHRIGPSEPFPEDLTVLSDTEIEVLNSRLHRELEDEYVHADPKMETELRLEEVNEELNRREGDQARSEESLTGKGHRAPVN